MAQMPMPRHDGGERGEQDVRRTGAAEGGDATVAPRRTWRRPEIAWSDGFLPSSEVAPRDSARRRLLAAADLVALALAYWAVWLLVPGDIGGENPLLLAAALPPWILLNKLIGLYDRDANLIHKSTLDEVPSIALSAVLGTALVFMLFPGVFGLQVGRAETLAFVGFTLVFTVSLRALVRGWVVRSYPRERCLIVGSGFVADLLARKITSHPEYGVELVGFVDVSDENGNGNGNGHALVGNLERFEEVCKELQVERVVIAFSSVSHEELINVICTSKTLQIKISVVPRLFEVIGHAVEVDQLEGTTLLGLRGFSRTRSSLALKRAMDLIGAGVGMAVLAPLFAAIAVAIKLTSRGPVFFVQDRIGRGTRPFGIYKFRTMFHGADALKEELAHLNEVAHPMFKISEDPRVTRVGRLLRRTSIDELPQLINVLKGEMSLVGPRPLVPSEDDYVIGYHRERLDLTPGLTGIWQVLGRSTIPFQEMVKLDYLYVAEWSLWNDLKLLIRTAPVVLRGNGH
jgi:exopolysaccharide biosynthesis polyprenyl glycosylphosphotransferase